MKTWTLLCGYCSKSKALVNGGMCLALMCVAQGSLAQPPTQNNDSALDEAFLLFLADSTESNNELLDPLSMVENKETQANNETDPDNKEANDE